MQILTEVSQFSRYILDQSIIVALISMKTTGIRAAMVLKLKQVGGGGGGGGGCISMLSV